MLRLHHRRQRKLGRGSPPGRQHPEPHARRRPGCLPARCAHGFPDGAEGASGGDARGRSPQARDPRRLPFASRSRRVLFGDRSRAGVLIRSTRARLSRYRLHRDVDSGRQIRARRGVRLGFRNEGIRGDEADRRMSRAWPLDAEPTVGSAPPWAGAAAPAPAVRRRENLRSASFRDYAMARVTPAPDPKKRMRAEFTLSTRRVPVRTGDGARRVSFCVILERFWITPLPPAEALSAAEGEESRIRRCAMAVKFLRSGQKWCCPAGVLTKTFHVKRFLVQENETRMAVT